MTQPGRITQTRIAMLPNGQQIAGAALDANRRACTPVVRRERMDTLGAGGSAGGRRRGRRRGAGGLRGRDARSARYRPGIARARDPQAHSGRDRHRDGRLGRLALR